MSETTTPTARSLELAAQAWCAPECGSIEMDSRLATAFAVILDRELASAPVSQRVREALEYVIRVCRQAEELADKNNTRVGYGHGDPKFLAHEFLTGSHLTNMLDKCEKAAEALTLLAPDTRTEWQPIETVPRDGTRVLVCDGNGTGTGRLLDDGSWAVGGGCGYRPTHWMPLPAAPSGKVVPHV